MEDLINNVTNAYNEDTSETHSARSRQVIFSCDVTA